MQSATFSPDPTLLAVNIFGSPRLPGWSTDWKNGGAANRGWGHLWGRLSAGVCRGRGIAPGPKEPHKRRLQARLPAPHLPACYLSAVCPGCCGVEVTSLRARAKSSLSLAVILSATSVLAPRNFAPRLSCVVAQITS